MNVLSAQAAPLCATCGSIPADLWVNTGRDDSFPDAVRWLFRFELSYHHDLYRCPSCEAWFVWEDLPQFYGSGNNAEERLTRLDPAQSLVVQALLDPLSQVHDYAGLYTQALSIVSEALVYTILHHLAQNQPQALVGFLEPLLTKVAASSNLSICTIITSYAGKHHDRLRDLNQRLQRDRGQLSGSYRYLQEWCEQRLAEVGA